VDTFLEISKVLEIPYSWCSMYSMLLRRQNMCVVRNIMIRKA